MAANYIDMEGWALALVAKVGSQSFMESGPTWYIREHEILIYPERIFFMRDPFQRLESAYSFFVGLVRAGTPHNAVPEAALESWEKFVDYVLDPRYDDEHWRPQTETTLYIGDGTDRKLVPTKIMRFEDVTKWWPNFFSRNLPHINRSTKLVTTSYRGDEIRVKYAADYKIYDDLVPYDNLSLNDRGWPLKQSAE